MGTELNELDIGSEIPTLAAFFESHPKARDYLHRSTERLFKSCGVDASEHLEAPDPDFLGACHQLNELIQGSSQRFQNCETEVELITSYATLVDEVNDICESVLNLIKQKRVNPSHLIRFYEVLVPWICSDNFISNSFWRARFSKEMLEDIDTEYPGSSFLMMLIRHFYKVKQDKNLLELRKTIPDIHMACMLDRAALSVMQRTAWIGEKLVDYHHRGPLAQEPLFFLELAGGDGALSEDILTRFLSGEDKERFKNLTLIDGDQRTLDETTFPRLNSLRDRIKEMALEVLHKNIFRDRKAIQTALKGKTIVASIGFIDYATNKWLSHMLKTIINEAQPGASIALGVFKTNYPHEAFMRLILQWELITRTEDELKTIAEEAGLSNVEVHGLAVEGDPNSVYQLVLLGRTPTLKEREEEARLQGAASSSNP